MDKKRDAKKGSGKSVKIKIWVVAAVAIAVAAAGIVHTAICYANILKAGMNTSFPASVALLILIPYVIAVAIDLLVGGLVIRVIARKNNKTFE